MKNMPIAQARPQDYAGVYWTPPAKATLAEIHPLLMARLVGKPDYQKWSVYSADVFDMMSGGPLGYFEVACDPPTRRACGYYSAIGSRVVMRSPIWFECAGDVDHAMRAFHALVREAGHVD
ncbi:hypothetical protein JNB88_31925 [Rhizobium cauense]|uniref:hypothetical protein n=1 Tax=Rhizobium cauense TaxID=1166683 RepID=UPI001C6E59A0|nr:hypothetical protein [Rhizobium cauense]MBW9118222.1 hypothetical protein [Rhizobium cauense]